MIDYKGWTYKIKIIIIIIYDNLYLAIITYNRLYLPMVGSVRHWKV